MADLVKIPLYSDLVHAQILVARLRSSGFELELLGYQDDSPFQTAPPHLLVHAADEDEIRAILADEEAE